MTEELKPCPFCGSENISAEITYGYAAVLCFNCEAEGPAKSEPEDAVSAWNRRA